MTANPLSPKKASKARHAAGEKYSSKFCSGVIDGVIKAQMEEVTKNSVTTEKWLSKLKTSLLRKISACSKVAFLPEEQQPEALKELIEVEQDRINCLTFSIQEAAEKAMEARKLSTLQVLPPQRGSVKHGRFDKHVTTISRQLTKVAHELNRVAKQTDSRTEKLSALVEDVDANWKKPAANAKRSSSPGKAAGSASPSSSSSLSSSPAKGKGALGKLHNHLDTA